MSHPPQETRDSPPARRAGAAAAAALTVALVAGISGCDLLELDREPFTIRVDSISAPATIAPGDTLTVRFHGWVGLDGCHRLDRVERARSPGRLELRFQGLRRTGSYNVCTSAPVKLDHEERVMPPLEDPFTILVRQPRGRTLERVVRVE
jgi:hypothetical protein